ncbi:MAG: porin [Pandoraea sp.]|uniref:porin n=1 Tax=Pandoraea sp. 64-18 TaxID=1895806 RepID=UPI001AC7E7F0|nr:porin [Pandoraea sp. 64-18]MBN9116289.1 porin [Pandoraea sp.]
MNRTAFGAAVLAMLSALPVAAQAQSSVTLYGRVVAGVTMVNNAGRGHVWEGDTCGPPGCNEWGLKGREDLGGGTAAIFTLENGFNIQNGRLGQGGVMFGRQAFVGLTNQQWGTLTLGRQYDPPSETVGYFPSSNNFATGYGSHFGDLDNLNQSIRINNSVKYVSPTWSGLRVSGLYSLGGVPGSMSTNQVRSLAAMYTRGPFALAVGYLDIHNPATSPDGTGGVYASNGNYVGSLGRYVALQDAKSMKSFTAGGSYALGRATLALNFAHTALDQSQYFVANGFAGAGSGSDFTMNSYEASVTYQFTPALVGGAAYIYNAGKATYQNLKPNFQQVNLGLRYSLSKRTSLYGVAIFQKAAGDGIAPVLNANGQAVGRTAIAEIPGAGVDSGSARQLLISVGMYHSF